MKRDTENLREFSSVPPPVCGLAMVGPCRGRDLDGEGSIPSESTERADVVEQVDTPDLDSGAYPCANRGLQGVRVRFPPSAPFLL